MSDNRLSIKQKIAYAPLGCLLWLMSKMPLRLLYILADFIAFLAYRIVRYRKKLVRRNLSDSFPELSANDLLKIEKRFYRHLADYFVEAIKLPGMSRKQMHKRMKFHDAHIIDELFDKGKSIVIYTSHFGNWEWITSIADWCRTQNAVYAHVYRPLNNKWFDRYFLHIRSIYNHSIPMKSVFRQLVSWKRDNILSITGFLSDQKPDWGGQTITKKFLGRDTQFIYGTEELARKLGMAVLYFDTSADRRGYYSSTIRLITENAANEPEGCITEKYIKNLDSTIRRNPAAYLWSHNRWRLDKKKL